MKPLQGEAAPGRAARPARVAMIRAGGWRRMILMTAAVIALDQGTKAIADSLLARGEDVGLVLGLQLTNVRNTGVAFGLLSDGGGAVIAVTVVALAILLAVFARRPARPGLWLPVGLVAGGAVSNLADRVRIDAVIDFIDPPRWPAFNLADVAIVVGVLWVVYTLETPDRRTGRDAAA